MLVSAVLNPWLKAYGGSRWVCQNGLINKGAGYIIYREGGQGTIDPDMKGNCARTPILVYKNQKLQKDMTKRIIWLLMGIVILAAVLRGPIMSNVEQARYDVVESHGTIEIRDYAPMIVAEVGVTGDREKAIGDGFRLIADYIFGNNIPAQKVAMTAPVIQQPSEKIAMTAPVTQQGGEGLWVVRFVMPSGYTLQTLPQPNNAEVILKEVARKRFAVIRFSGRAKDDSLEEHTKELEAFIQARNLQAVAEPSYAFFNPPWTLPFLRRNEVMLEISR